MADVHQSPILMPCLLQHPIEIHSRLRVQFNLPADKQKPYFMWAQEKGDILRDSCYPPLGASAPIHCVPHCLLWALGWSTACPHPHPSRLQGISLEPPLWRTKREGEYVFSRMEPPDKLSSLRGSALNKYTYEPHKSDSTGCTFIYLCILCV
jgi:hypothetical protein